MAAAVEVIVQAENVQRAFGPTKVFKGASFVIHPGDKIALVGPNGAGKTTLFRLLMGDIAPDYGEIQFKDDIRVAYLPQVPDIPDDTPVVELLSAPTARAKRIQGKLEALEAWMAEPDAWDQPDAQAKMQTYSELQAALGEERSKGTATDHPLLNELALPEGILEQNFGNLSGGERSKVLLVKAFAAAQTADLLLLDEPTNHMDIDTVELIEEHILALDCAVVLSAHDQYLLDNTCDRVFEVDNYRVAQYTGDYTSYLGQRDAIRRAIAAKKKRQFHEVKRQLAIIEQLKSRNRFDSQVKSRKTRLERHERSQNVPVMPTARKGFRLLFDTDTPPKQSIILEHVAKRYGERTLYEGLTFEIEGGDKIGIVGANGCGKSTFLKMLLGQEGHEGDITVARGVKVGYFDQHHSTLDPERTLIDEARSLRDPPPPDDWSRGLLGRFHFTGDDVFKQVKHLSGGERARLALAKFIVDRHNTLILEGAIH